MKCKICSSPTKRFVRYEILNKYEIDLFKCNSCEFLMTENPYWLEESYQESIAQLDIGYVTRNIVYSNMCNSIFSNYSTKDQNEYLDYGGGYGLLTRIMRDKGYSFHNHDKYTVDIFAKPFTITQLENNHQFRAITCFEVFEHLEDPMNEIKTLLKHSDEIIFSTDLHENLSPESIKNWRYLLPETGQHISFFHANTFLEIARTLGIFFYSNGKDFHMLTKKKYIFNPIIYPYYINQIKDKFFGRNFLNKKSLLMKDYNFINNK